MRAVSVAFAAAWIAACGGGSPTQPGGSGSVDVSFSVFEVVGGNRTWKLQIGDKTITTDGGHSVRLPAGTQTITGSATPGAVLHFLFITGAEADSLRPGNGQVATAGCSAALVETFSFTFKVRAGAC